MHEREYGGNQWKDIAQLAQRSSGVAVVGRRCRQYGRVGMKQERRSHTVTAWRSTAKRMR